MPARIQASEHDRSSPSLHVPAHHSSWVRAASGNRKPSKPSIWSNLSTTMSAYRFVRYLWSVTHLGGTSTAFPGTASVRRFVGHRSIHFHIGHSFQRDERVREFPETSRDQPVPGATSVCQFLQGAACRVQRSPSAIEAS